MALTDYNYTTYPSTVSSGSSGGGGGGGSGSSSGVTTVGPFGQVTGSPNGATINSTTIFFQEATTLFPGMVSSNSQTFSGPKTFIDPLAVLYVAPDNTNAVATTFSVTENVTSSASVTVIGVQGVASLTVQSGAVDDKALFGLLYTTQRGDGTDSGNLHNATGVGSLLFHNTSSGGSTDEVVGFDSTIFTQGGTITNAYDFRSMTVPAGPGVITNAFGLYVTAGPITAKKSWIGDKTTLGGTSFTAPNDELFVKGTARVNSLFKLDGSTSGTFSQTAADTTTDYTVKWPDAQATSSNSVLINDTLGNLSWGQASGTTGTASSIAGYDPSGALSSVPLSNFDANGLVKFSPFLGITGSTTLGFVHGIESNITTTNGFDVTNELVNFEADLQVDAGSGIVDAYGMLMRQTVSGTVDSIWGIYAQSNIINEARSVTGVHLNQVVSGTVTSNILGYTQNLQFDTVASLDSYRGYSSYPNIGGSIPSAMHGYVDFQIGASIGPTSIVDFLVGIDLSHQLQSGSLNSNFTGISLNPQIETQGIQNIRGFVAGGVFGNTSSTSVQSFISVFVNPDFETFSSTGGYTGVDVSPPFRTGSKIQNYQSQFLHPSFETEGIASYSGILGGAQFGQVSSTDVNQANEIQVGSNFGPNSSTGGYTGIALNPTMQPGARMQTYSGIAVAGQYDVASSSYIAGLSLANRLGQNGPVRLATYQDLTCNPLLAAGASIQDFSGILQRPNVSSGSFITGNYKGVDIGVNGPLGVAQVTGLGVDVSQFVCSQQKTAINSQGGAHNLQSPIDTSAFTVGPGTTGNQVGGQLHVETGFPLANTFVFGNNLAFVSFFEDNMGDDGTGIDLGFTNVGFVNSLVVTSSVTVDAINMALSGSGLPPQSTGGTVTDYHMYRAVGILPSGGTVNVTNMYAFRASGALSAVGPTNLWGISVEDATAENYFQKSLAIGGVTKKVTASNYGLQLFSKDLQVQSGSIAAPTYIFNSSASGNVTITANPSTTSYSLTLPGAQGGANQFLTNSGTGSLSWTSVSTSTISSITYTSTDYTASVNDQTILAGSGTGTITLFDLSGNAGRSLTINRIYPSNDSTFVTGSGGQTIGYGASASFALDARNESLVLTAASGSWVVKNWTGAEKETTATVTGNNSWSTTQAKLIPYKTWDGTWRARFNIRGTTSIATSETISIGSITFKNQANFEQYVTGGALAGANNTAGLTRTSPGTGDITSDIVAVSASWGFCGDVELDSRPTLNL